MYFGRSSNACGENAQIISRELDGTETVLYEFPTNRDFGFSFALDNANGTTRCVLRRGELSGLGLRGHLEAVRASRLQVADLGTRTGWCILDSTTASPRRTASRRSFSCRKAQTWRGANAIVVRFR